MTKESDYILSKVRKIEVIDHIRQKEIGKNVTLLDHHKRLGLNETLQIKSIEMYGHTGYMGRDLVYHWWK